MSNDIIGAVIYVIEIITLDLVIELKIHDVDDVKLSLSEKCLHIKLSTIFFMLELEQCVEHIFFDLCQYTNIISDKFKYFVTYLRQKLYK